MPARRELSFELPHNPMKTCLITPPESKPYETPSHHAARWPVATLIDFYTQVLGMTLLRKSENPEYNTALLLSVRRRQPGQAEIELTWNWDADSYEMGTAYVTSRSACPTPTRPARRSGGRWQRHP